MNTVNIHYSKANNAGDKLNKELFEYFGNYKVNRSDALNSLISGIGSGLGEYTYSDSKKKNIKKFINGIIHPTVYIFGTGFLEYSSKKEHFFKRNMKFLALRGNLTKERVEKILNRKIDIAIGDPGILISELIDIECFNKSIENKYEVGIIAHFKEKDEEAFKKLVNHYPNSLFIDIQDEPLEVAKNILSCKTILSSSLHGLIFSDSLRIPNIHIVATNKLLGDGYKFDDYYSGFGIDHTFIDINNENYPDLSEVKKEYKITSQMVQNMKTELLIKFPKIKENGTKVYY